MPNSYILEKNKRLSESLIWELQDAYYTQIGVEAWAGQRIPAYITTNAFIAKNYARIILGFLRDCLHHATTQPFDESQPLYIVELGAGSGRLGYVILKQLLTMKHLLGLQDIPICYVLTDLAEKNLHFWNRHPLLQSLLEGNVLDVALFDVSQDNTITLQHSGKTLAADTLVNPLVVIANYVFDTLPQDAFLLQNGKLFESLVTSTSNQPELDLNDPTLIKRIKRIYDHQAIIAKYYYNDPLLNNILQAYQETLPNTNFAMPVGAFDCLGNLLTLSNKHLFLLSADKAQCHRDELIQDKPIDLSFHDSSFSIPVNFEAIGQYFHQQNGYAVHPSQRDIPLKVSAFLMGRPLNNLGETLLALKDTVEGFGPFNYNQFLQQLFEEPDYNLPLATCLNFLRLSQWDPHIFYLFHDAILKQLETASTPLKAELVTALTRIAESCYPLENDKLDYFFDIASIFMHLKQAKPAIHYFNLSLYFSQHDHHIVYYNMGICYYAVQNLTEAQACFNKALEVNPNYTQAMDWIKQITREIGRLN